MRKTTEKHICLLLSLFFLSISVTHAEFPHDPLFKYQVCAWEILCFSSKFSHFVSSTCTREHHKIQQEPMSLMPGKMGYLIFWHFGDFCLFSYLLYFFLAAIGKRNCCFPCWSRLLYTSPWFERDHDIQGQLWFYKLRGWKKYLFF